MGLGFVAYVCVSRSAEPRDIKPSRFRVLSFGSGWGTIKGLFLRSSHVAGLQLRKIR